MEVSYRHDGDGDAELELIVERFNTKGDVDILLNGQRFTISWSKNEKKKVVVKDCRVIAEGTVEVEPKW